MAEKEYIERWKAVAETRKPRLTDAELRRRLALIPAADVRSVVRAKWVESEKVFEDDWGNIIEKKCICSACGFTQKETNVYGSSGYIRKSNFCPNCGADMREPPKEVRV